MRKALVIKTWNIHNLTRTTYLSTQKKRRGKRRNKRRDERKLSRNLIGPFSLSLPPFGAPTRQLITFVTFVLLFVNCCRSLSHRASSFVTASLCDMVYNSDSTKIGIVTSPGYPNSYPPRTHCTYDFQGRGKERVQVIFQDLNLYHSPNDPPNE